MSSIPKFTSHDKSPLTYKEGESTDKSQISFSRGASELEMHSDLFDWSSGHRQQGLTGINILDRAESPREGLEVRCDNKESPSSRR